MDKKTVYLDQDADIEARVEDLLDRLTLEEKILLIRGRDFWTTNPIERLKVPSFGMTDGPLGVAYHSSHKGKRTRFPATIGLASTWNKELAFKMGEAMGKEMKFSGRHQILGPGVNIIRSPLCGRNFEYLSEDPVLSSDIGAEVIKGIQSQKIASCMKHYITNNSETKRMKISTEIGERALHEIYVKNYKRIIEKADPWGLMICYNKINGIHGAENKYVLRDILRDQLGFTGHVVTDWGAARGTSGAAGCIKAGLNLEMPGFLISRVMTPKKVKKALDDGDINEGDLNYIVRPLLRTFMRVGLFEETEQPIKKVLDIPEHQQIAKQIAEEGMVLLKNDSDFLPIKLDEVKKIAILGPNANKIFGKPLRGGSSAVVPPKEITPYEGIANYVSGKAEIVSNPENADVVFLFVGLDHGGHLLSMFLSKKEGDTEGRDRTHYALPDEQQQLIRETLVRNPNTVIILIAGSPIDCSNWFENVPAILNAWYPGMLGGDAIARVLFGEVNPSGKLPVTYPKKLEDHPAHKSKKRFPGDLKELKIYFDEGIYVGYRYFDKHQIEPFFPFGFGLSYSSFEMSNIQLDKTNLQGKGNFTVSVDVKNMGDKLGAEVIQIYVSDDECSVDRPPKELQGFEKVHLKPGEKKNVSITLNESAFEFYSEKEHEFKAETGTFTIWVGSSSRELPLSIKINYTE
ncbi:MAG: glycoside hydrolase family 3 C-terminal domain-containing protein [Promethearchaeota archaeon]